MGRRGGRLLQSSLLYAVSRAHVYVGHTREYARALTLLLLASVDLHHLLMRLLDRLRSIPALNEHPMHHSRQHVQGDDFIGGRMDDARIRELAPALEHGIPILEDGALPEVRIIHTWIRRSPASIALFDRDPQILGGHPVLSQSLGYLR